MNHNKSIAFFEDEEQEKYEFYILFRRNLGQNYFKKLQIFRRNRKRNNFCFFLQKNFTTWSQAQKCLNVAAEEVMILQIHWPLVKGNEKVNTFPVKLSMVVKKLVLLDS